MGGLNPGNPPRSLIAMADGTVFYVGDFEGNIALWGPGFRRILDLGEPPQCTCCPSRTRGPAGYLTINMANVVSVRALHADEVISWPTA